MQVRLHAKGDKSNPILLSLHVGDVPSKQLLKTSTHKYLACKSNKHK